MAILPLVAVLDDTSSCVVVSQMAIAASRRCYFTLGPPHPIIKSVTDQWFPLWVASRSFYYHEIYQLSPLLDQCDKG
jgi:hypothetical protein